MLRTLFCLRRWIIDEAAQTMAEYALILAIVSVAGITVLIVLGDNIGASFQYLADQLIL